jgi:hypothetical protein
MKAKAVQINAITVATNQEYYCSALQTFVGYAKSLTTFVGGVSYGKSRIQQVNLPNAIFSDFLASGVLEVDPASAGWGYYVPIPELPIFNAAIVTGIGNFYYSESLLKSVGL